MDINDIVTLAKAGFTAEQIAKMNTMQTQQTPPQTQPPTPPQTQPPTPPQTQPPTPQQTQPPTPPPTPSPMDALMAQVMNLTNAIQANALGNTSMPTPENADDILATIIDPPTKK